MPLSLDLVQTVAFAGLVLFLGFGASVALLVRGDNCGCVASGSPVG